MEGVHRVTSLHSFIHASKVNGHILIKIILFLGSLEHSPRRRISSPLREDASPPHYMRDAWWVTWQIESKQATLWIGSSGRRKRKAKKIFLPLLIKFSDWCRAKYFGGSRRWMHWWCGDFTVMRAKTRPIGSVCEHGCLAGDLRWQKTYKYILLYIHPPASICRPPAATEPVPPPSACASLCLRASRPEHVLLSRAAARIPRDSAFRC